MTEKYIQGVNKTGSDVRDKIIFFVCFYTFTFLNFLLGVCRIKKKIVEFYRSMEEMLHTIKTCANEYSTFINLIKTSLSDLRKHT